MCSIKLLECTACNFPVNFVKSSVMTSRKLFKVVNNDKRMVSLVKVLRQKQPLSKDNVLKTSKHCRKTLAMGSFLVSYGQNASLLKKSLH